MRPGGPAEATDSGGVPTRRLDALYAKHKGKQITPQQALEELTTLVGQTTVEQAGLVLSNIQTGTLPAGCAAVACTPAGSRPHSLTSPYNPLHPLTPSVSSCIPYTPYISAYRWVEYFDPQRNLPSSSIVVKCPPWQRLRSALAPPQGAPDGSWRLELHRGGLDHWAPQPLPRALESVASKAADSTAFDHLRLEAPSRLGTVLRWAPEQR